MARTRKVHHTRQDHVGTLRRIEHLGMSRGRGGSKTWLYVGTGLWTLRTIRRLADRREEILISEPLRPGDRLIIANDRPTLDDGPATLPRGRRAKRKYRKAQAKAEKKAAAADAKRAAKLARKESKRPKRAMKAKPAETVAAD